MDELTKAYKYVRDDLADNPEMFEAFVMSIRSAIHESDHVISETELALRIANRIIGD